MALGIPPPSLLIDPRTKLRRRHHRYEQTLGRAIAHAGIHAPIAKKATAHTLRHAEFKSFRVAET